MRIRKDGTRFIQDRPSQSFAVQARPRTEQVRGLLANSIIDLERASELAPEVAGNLKWALAGVKAALELL